MMLLVKNRDEIYNLTAYVGVPKPKIKGYVVVRQNTGKIYPNLEIHTEVYILIDLCSAGARVIISTGSTKFHPVAFFNLHISKMAANR